MKKLVTKTLLILLAVALVVSIAACGDNTPPAAPSEQPQQQQQQPQDTQSPPPGDRNPPPGIQTPPTSRQVPQIGGLTPAQAPGQAPLTPDEIRYYEFFEAFAEEFEFLGMIMIEVGEYLEYIETEDELLEMLEITVELINMVRDLSSELNRMGRIVPDDFFDYHNIFVYSLDLLYYGMVALEELLYAALIDDEGALLYWADEFMYYIEEFIMLMEMIE